MIRRPPSSPRTATLFPYTTLFRSGPARQIFAARKLAIKDAIETMRFVPITLYRVRNLLFCIQRKMMVLAEHRAKAAHLPHEPFLDLRCAFGVVTRIEKSAFAGKMKQDRTRFKQRQDRKSTRLN